MKKGYGIVYSKDNIISSVKNLQNNDEVEVRLSDGSFSATIQNIKCENK